MTSKLAALARGALLLFCLSAALPAHAAPAYPTGPVRVVVPFPPGAGVDIVTRLVAAKLSQDMGQQFVIENRSGAGGNVGAGEAARAPHDGYTLLAAPSSLAIGKNLYKHLPFDIEKDFEPIAMMASVPFVLVVNSKVPAKSVSELIALAKAHPGKLSFASTGNGSSPQLTAEMFKMQAHIDMLHVPYRGSSPALTDMISGRVSMMFANALSALPQVKAGHLRALAITSAEPSPSAPGVPTMAQAGLPGFESETWFALMAPAGTPQPIVDRLNKAVNRVLQMPDVQKALRLQGATTRLETPAQVDAYIKGEIAKSAKIIKAADIHIN